MHNRVISQRLIPTIGTVPACAGYVTPPRGIRQGCVVVIRIAQMGKENMARPNSFCRGDIGGRSDELRELAAPGSENAPWAQEYRASDLAMLTAPDVVARVEVLGIELVTVAEFFPGHPDKTPGACAQPPESRRR